MRGYVIGLYFEFDAENYRLTGRNEHFWQYFLRIEIHFENIIPCVIRELVYDMNAVLVVKF